MRKYLKILRYILQSVLLISLTFVIAYRIIQRYDFDGILITFIFDYIRYFIYLWLSIIIAYFLFLLVPRAGKVVQYLIISHVLIGIGFFLRLLLGVDWFMLGILLSLLILDTIFVALKPHRRRSLAVLIISVSFFIVFIIAILPAYKEPVDIAHFYDQQKHEVYMRMEDAPLLLQDAQASAVIHYAGIEHTYPITPNSSHQGLLARFSQSGTIDFASRVPLTNTAIIVRLIDGDVFALVAQSKAGVQFSGYDYVYTITQFSSGTTDISYAAQAFMSGLEVAYEQAFDDYLIDRLGGAFWLYPGIDHAVYWIISHIAKRYPDVYAQRLENYYAYDRLLSDFKDLTKKTIFSDIGVDIFSGKSLYDNSFSR